MEKAHSPCQNWWCDDGQRTFLSHKFIHLWFHSIPNTNDVPADRPIHFISTNFLFALNSLSVSVLQGAQGQMRVFVLLLLCAMCGAWKEEAGGKGKKKLFVSKQLINNSISLHTSDDDEDDDALASRTPHRIIYVCVGAQRTAVTERIHFYLFISFLFPNSNARPERTLEPYESYTCYFGHGVPVQVAYTHHFCLGAFGVRFHLCNRIRI